MIISSAVVSKKVPSIKIVLECWSNANRYNSFDKIPSSTIIFGKLTSEHWCTRNGSNDQFINTSLGQLNLIQAQFHPGIGRKTRTNFEDSPPSNLSGIYTVGTIELAQRLVHTTQNCRGLQIRFGGYLYRLRSTLNRR